MEFRFNPGRPQCIALKLNHEIRPCIMTTDQQFDGTKSWLLHDRGSKLLTKRLLERSRIWIGCNEFNDVHMLGLLILWSERLSLEQPLQRVDLEAQRARLPQRVEIMADCADDDAASSVLVRPRHN